MIAPYIDIKKNQMIMSFYISSLMCYYINQQANFITDIYKLSTVKLVYNGLKYIG